MEGSLSVVSVLKGAKKRLPNPDSWARETYFVPDPRTFEEEDEEITACCLSGALFRSINVQLGFPAVRLIWEEFPWVDDLYMQTVRALGFRDDGGLVKWNDAPTTTFEMIHARLDEAIQKLEA